MDDNKVLRQLIKVTLEAEGFEVVTAADGAECLEVAPCLLPDTITLDVVMPRLDGLRAAAALRDDARTRDIPIVLVSGCTELEGSAGPPGGVDAFVAKPFEPAELVRVVCDLVDQARARRRTATEDPEAGAADRASTRCGPVAGKAVPGVGVPRGLPSCESVTAPPRRPASPPEQTAPGASNTSAESVAPADRLGAATTRRLAGGSPLRGNDAWGGDPVAGPSPR